MRTYGDACKAAHALDLVGERWALLVVRELLFGPKRFTDLRAGLPGASPDVLAQRLRELEAAGVLRRRKLGPPVSSQVYELTEWGAELEPVVVALGRWGARSPLAEDDLDSSADAYALALKSDFDPEAAGDLEASYELRLGEDPFRVRVADREIHVARGRADQPDAVIEAEPRALADVLFGDSTPAQARRSGAIRIEGSAAVARRFFGLFPPPTLAERPTRPARAGTGRP
jgi:DNA-binding HxlR family transcriptional regulator